MGQFGTTDIMSPLVSYYLAAASVFEPEKSERIGWAKTTILVDTISSFFNSPHLSKEDRRDFVDEFRNKLTSVQHSKCVLLSFLSLRLKMKLKDKLAQNH